jgi:hypothetical protein
MLRWVLPQKYSMQYAVCKKALFFIDLCISIDIKYHKRQVTQEIQVTQKTSDTKDTSDTKKQVTQEKRVI